jgi:hypothetical protein
VITRAALFHHVNFFRAAKVGQLQWNCLIELGGIALIGLASYRVSPADATRSGRVSGTG